MTTKRFRSLGKGTALCLIAAAFGLVAVMGSAEAVPIAVGSATLDGVATDGTVNYAVFTGTAFASEAAAFPSGFSPGLSSPGLTLASDVYVYLYQLVNDGDNANRITTFTTGIGSGVDVLAWGYFSGVLLTPDGGFTSGATTNPNFPSVIRSLTSVNVQSFNILDGGTSGLLLYTSHFAPGLVNTTIAGPGPTGSVSSSTVATLGASVTSVPEPGSLLLLSAGVAGLLGFHGARRKHSLKGGNRMGFGRLSLRYLQVALLTAFAVVGLGSRGEAAPIADFTGNTFLSGTDFNGTPGTGVDGTVNYAVFSGADFLAAAGSIGSFVAGTGSGALDTSGYVYLFQITNNGNNDFPISGVHLGIPGVAPSSFGYFASSVFTDGLGGLAVSATNNLGSDESTPVGGSGMRTGVTSVGYTAAPDAIAPGLVFLQQGMIGDEVANLFFGPEVFAGGTTPLLAYTTSAPPSMVLGQFLNGGTIAFGPVPGPGELQTVPEPGTLLLLGSGVFGAAVMYRRKREEV